MKRSVFTLLPVCCLLLVGGCASNEVHVAKSQPITAAKAEQPKTVPVPVAAPVVSPGKLLNAIAAVVNDEIITLYDVNHDAQPIIRENEKKSALDGAALIRIRRDVLEKLVEKMLVEQKIKELGVKVSEDEIKQAIEDVKKQNNLTQETLIKALAGQGLTFDQYHAQLQDQLEKLKLVSMEVRSKIHVSATEARDFYDSNQAKYREEETFRARHIFFKTSEKAPAEEIKRSMTTALMVLAEAKSGKDFAELAKSYSEDPAARKDGGDLGRFKKGDMQTELEQAIIAMKPGEVSELVYTSLGFHIIKLEERVPGKLKPFESVKNEIDELIYRKKSEERFTLWAKDLRSKASVEIKELPGIL